MLSADGETLAVGAPLEDSPATGINGNQAHDCAAAVPLTCADNAGAVYVFRRMAGVWTQDAYLKASNAGQRDNFGASLAMSADGATLVVGAPYEDSNATGVNAPLSGTVLQASGTQANNSRTDSGAVYVFRRMGVAWMQEAYLKASNPDEFDRFGWGVAVAGDGASLAVSALEEDSTATGINGNQTDNTARDSGAVYVFRSAGGVWAQEVYVKASNAGANDRFGVDLAMSGDGTLLAVGALFEDSNATGANGSQADNSSVDAGAVYVFRRLGGVWAQEAYLKASNTEPVTPQFRSGESFGASVALSRDAATLAVGASRENSNATGVNGNQTDNSSPDSGAVYVFRRSGSAWAQEAYVKPSNTGVADMFGWDVALSDDGTRLAVGANNEGSNTTGVDGNQADNSATTAGAAYVFRRTGGVWAQEAYVKASNTGVQDKFGSIVALSGGGSTLAVGAEQEDSNATGFNGNQLDNSASESGAVYIFAR